MALKKLNTNFVDICKQTSLGRLSNDLEFNNKAMIGIYLVPKNYPFKKSDKYDIYLDKDVVNSENIVLGNVELLNDHLYSLNLEVFSITLKEINFIIVIIKYINKSKEL